jgi:hypothetical protein
MSTTLNSVIHRFPMLRKTAIRTPVSRIVSSTVLVSVVVLVGLLSLGVGSGLAAAPTPTPTNSTQSTSTLSGSTSTHTLVIRTGNGPGKYIVSVTGNVSTSKLESSDVVQLPVVQGAVGEERDTVDVIRFTGHITSFKSRGTLHVTLDNRLVNPMVLDANYIRLSSQTTGTTHYRLVTTGTIVPGGDAEGADYNSTNTSRVDGTISPTDRTDAFYYTGQFSTSRASNNLTVVINSQQIPVVKNGSHPTETTPRSTATRPSGTPVTQSSTPQTVTTATQPPVSTGHSPSSGAMATDSETGASSSAGGSGLSLLELVGGIVLMVFVAIGGFVLISR